MTTVIAVLQARCSSRRLPGKVMRPLVDDQPMLACQLERIARARRIDRIVVATSVDASDDPIASLCRRLSVPCSRGSLEDVLDRVYRAARDLAPNHVVRLTGDCPLADPAVIDTCIDLHLATGSDYTSNAGPPTFPDGLDVEVMTFAALETAWRDARLPSEREHVTPYIRTRPQLFRSANLTHPTNLSHLRWTVDEPVDMDLVQAIYADLYHSPAGPVFGMDDILAWLDAHPDALGLNRHIQRNEGYQRSLANDRPSALPSDRQPPRPDPSP